MKDQSTGAYSPLPSWLVNVAGLDFSVQTDDLSNVGVYYISIIGSVSENFMDPTYEEELIIELIVSNDCGSDEVTALDFIQEELYYITESGVRSFAPTWSTTVAGCPVTYEIGRIDDQSGLERALTVEESAVITFSDIDG